MAAQLRKYVCNDKTAAYEAMGLLKGDDFQVIFGPEAVNYGTTDMTRFGEQNFPYADAWVVIGKKD